jgi:hypothetical protein
MCEETQALKLFTPELQTKKQFNGLILYLFTCFFTFSVFICLFPDFWLFIIVVQKILIIRYFI